MTPPKFRKAVAPESSRPLFDRLKDHPIWVFSSGVAAMATFTLAVILPGATAYLNAQIETMKPAQEQLKVANERLEKLGKQLEKAVADRNEATLKNPFASDSAYPNGLGQILIGNSISKISDIYAPSDVTDMKTDPDDDSTIRYKSVQTASSVFSQATYYYYTKGDKANSVDFILFHPKSSSEVSHDYLRNRLAQVHGNPLAESNGRAFWKVTPRENLEIDANGNIAVRSGNDIPSWAQKKIFKPKSK